MLKRMERDGRRGNTSNIMKIFGLNTVAGKLDLIGLVCIVFFISGVSAAYGQSEPLDWTQLMKGLLTKGQTRETSTLESRENFMIDTVLKRGIDFKFSADHEKMLRKTGAGESLIRAVETAKQYPPKEIKNPNSAQFYFQRAFTCPDRDFQCRLDNFVKAVRLNPKYGDAYGQRALTYWMLNRKDLAAADFSKALELLPNFAFQQFLYGMFLLDTQNYSGAIAQFTKAIEINPRYSDAYYGRGNGYQFLSNFGKALADFSNAIKYNPNEVESYVKRGKLYAQMSNYQPAIADFTKAIQINPQNAELYIERAKIFEMLGDRKRAYDDNQKARQLKNGQSS